MSTLKQPIARCGWVGVPAAASGVMKGRERGGGLPPQATPPSLSQKRRGGGDESGGGSHSVELRSATPLSRGGVGRGRRGGRCGGGGGSPRFGPAGFREDPGRGRVGQLDDGPRGPEGLLGKIGGEVLGAELDAEEVLDLGWGKEGEREAAAAFRVGAPGQTLRLRKRDRPQEVQGRNRNTYAPTGARKECEWKRAEAKGATEKKERGAARLFDRSAAGGGVLVDGHVVGPVEAEALGDPPLDRGLVGEAAAKGDDEAVHGVYVRMGGGEGSF